MAPYHALVALLSLAVTASAQFAQATSTSAFWTYTSRLAAFASPSPYTNVNGVVRTYTFTDVRTVKPSVTPTATPTSTTTYNGRYEGVQIVYQYYGVGALAESDLVPENDYYSSTRTSTSVSTSIIFSMPVTMTAPASCPTAFTVTTTATVSIPSQVWDQIKPTSTINAGVSTLYGGYGYQYNIQTWYLSAEAAPFTSTSYLYYRLYVASCSTLPSSRTTTSARTTSTGGGFVSGGGGGGGSRNDNSDGVYCYRYSYYCGTPLKTWIIIIASVIPGLFLLGFLESWLWFRRLMIGKSAMRFGTICWVLMSLWILCFTRMQDARSKEDQKLLQEKWKNMGSGAAFKAWWKWGFRHAYPVEHLGQFSRTTVGIVPAGEPLHPAMAQAPPTFTPGAPGQQGQVYYYGPPPPGWVPTPDGQGFMPPQGYMYPPPQQAEYYGSDVSKDRTMVSSSPVSTVTPQHPTSLPHAQAYPVSPMAQTSLQPVQPAPGVAQIPVPSPPPQGPIPSVPTSQAPAPPANMSEAPATSRDTPAVVSEAPAHHVQKPANAPQPPPPKSDPNNRDLYD